MRGIRVLLPMLVLPLIAAAQQTSATPAAQLSPTVPRAMQPNDWHRVIQLTTPALSPDGKRVAFTVTTVIEKENKRHAEIWVANTAGGDPVRWTSPGFESSNPRWSDDGKFLYFVSNRPGGRGVNWAIRLDEPGGEAFQPDSIPEAKMQPRDKSFAVTVVTDSTGGRRGAQSLAVPPVGAITQPIDQARFDGRQIVNFPYKANGAGFIVTSGAEGGSRGGRGGAAGSRPTQIFIQRKGETKRTPLTSTAYSHSDVAVSPDGKWIAFTADAQLRSDSLVRATDDSIAKLPYDRMRDEAPRNDADIYVISSAGGAPRKVAALAGTESQISWAPDSRRIAFLARSGRYKNSALYVIDAAGGAPQNLTNGWQYEPNTFNWLPNGEIAMAASMGGRSGLNIVNAKTGQLREAVGGRRSVRGWSWDEKKSKVAFIATSVSKPTELFIADWDGKNERRLTSFNDKLNAEIGWADAERFTYQSVGGLTIEAWLMKPFGYTPAKKYPVVVYIHGGPHSQYDEGWFDEFQSLAGGGMMVLYTNPRGSSGYNTEFTYSTRGRWGAEDYWDIMKATDIVAARADIDSTRMGVTGGSYGGFMTAWIETKTNRFKAAEADRMIVNWVSWYSASDAQGLTEGEFFGKPWENPTMYDTLSPIKYVSKAKTPTLIVQSEEDYRAPIVEAEQWFMSLRKQGVPAEFIRYPRSNHDLSRTGEPWLLVDRLGRIRQWFTYWLKP